MREIKNLNTKTQKFIDEQIEKLSLRSMILVFICCFLLLLLFLSYILVPLFHYLGENYPTISWAISISVFIILFGRKFWFKFIAKAKYKIPLDEQLNKLNDLGILLKEGIGKGTLLKEYDESEYETNPYELLLSVMGSETIGERAIRQYSDQVINFDYECIEDTNDYTAIVTKFAKLASLTDQLSFIESHVSFKSETAQLSYTIGDITRSLNPIFDGDWVDADIIKIIIEDIENVAVSGQKFWSMDNGQAQVYLFISDKTANNINTLKNNIVHRSH